MSGDRVEDWPVVGAADGRFLPEVRFFPYVFCGRSCRAQWVQVYRQPPRGRKEWKDHG